MGCDIHALVQIKQNEKWKTVVTDFCENRNYDKFAILADVRNGFGFARVITGDGFIPISSPKGLPDDFEVDEEYEHDGFWMGDHSHSYLSLKEIEKYYKEAGTRFTKKRGFLTEDHYLEIKKEKIRPRRWCGGVSGANVLCLSEEQYKTFKNSENKNVYIEVYIEYEWKINYLDSTDLKSILDELEKIRNQYNLKSEEIRMVFGFDN